MRSSLTREQVVDQEVVRLTQSRQPYLNALLAIASTQSRLDLAPAPLFLRKRHLTQRVSQILKEVNMSRTRIAASLAGFSLLLLLAGMFMVRTLPLEAAPQVKDAPGVSVEQAEANLLHRAPVDYPLEAREKGIQGTVTLEVDIDETGAVTDARVLSGPQELRKAALQSVLQWHYSKNMPLPAKAQVGVKFELPPPAAATEVRKQPVIVTPAAQASPTIGILKIVDLSSLPEELRSQLQQKLASYQGQAFSIRLMREIEREAKDVDKHLVFKWSTIHVESGQRAAYILSLSLEPGDVGGGVFRAGSGVPAGVQVDASPRPEAAPAGPGSTPQRIRVGGNVQQMMLLEQPRPVYPPEAKQARIQGVVRLEAIIAKDGTMANLTVQSGHPLLVPAALEAVKNWVYYADAAERRTGGSGYQIDVNFTLVEVKETPPCLH